MADEIRSNPVLESGENLDTHYRKKVDTHYRKKMEGKKVDTHYYWLMPEQWVSIFPATAPPILLTAKIFFKTELNLFAPGTINEEMA